MSIHTPLGAPPGVEIHVELVEAALNGTYLTGPDYFTGAELVLILVAVMLRSNWLMLPCRGACFGKPYA